jgi:hypothetical protein
VADKASPRALSQSKLWAETDLLSPAEMHPIQEHVRAVNDGWTSDQATIGPVVPVIRSSVDSDVQAATNNEIQTIHDLATALLGLTFGDGDSILTLGQLLQLTEDTNIDVASQWSGGGHHS